MNANPLKKHNVAHRHPHCASPSHTSVNELTDLELKISANDT